MMKRDTQEVPVPSPKAIRERYREIRERLDAAAERCGRPASSVILLADTTGAEPEHIRALVELGHVDFGEHRAQSLLQRAAAIEEFLSRHRTLTGDHSGSVPDKVRWHMLGEIQRPKLRKLTDTAQVIHSVDNLRVAEDLQNATMHRDHPIDILLDVNTSLRKDSGGLTIPAAGHVAELIHSMFHLRLRGLAMQAPADMEETGRRATYQRCRELFQEIHGRGQAGKDFNVLCMGGSDDFEIAVEQGANIVRIGAALFEAQQKPSSKAESSKPRSRV